MSDDEKTETDEPQAAGGDRPDEAAGHPDRVQREGHAVERPGGRLGDGVDGVAGARRDRVELPLRPGALAGRAVGDVGELVGGLVGALVHDARGTPAEPAGLAGDWHCAELATTWTIAPAEAGLAVQVRGPLTTAGPWPIEPIAGEAIRIRTPGTLFQGWLDARLEGDTLVVSGARASGLRFSRG